MRIETAEALAEAALTEARHRITRAIDDRIEAQARAMGYNSAASLAGYSGSTAPQYREEALAFIAWRDQCWLSAFEVLNKAEQTGVVPTVEAVLDALPKWTGGA
jgi:hypothetical protein